MRIILRDPVRANGSPELNLPRWPPTTFLLPQLLTAGMERHGPSVRVLELDRPLGGPRDELAARGAETTPAAVEDDQLETLQDQPRQRRRHRSGEHKLLERLPQPLADHVVIHGLPHACPP